MRNKRLIPLVLVIAITLSAFTCSHKAASTSRGVAASLVALQDSEIALHKQGRITDPEHELLQQGFISLGEAGIQVDKCIGAGGSPACVDTGIAMVDIFINSKANGIKNPDSKAAIIAAATALKSSLLVLKGAL